MSQTIEQAKIERRTLAAPTASIELRDTGDGADQKIVGYAAVYYDGTPDTEFVLWGNVREHVMPGAFDNAIETGQDVRGLFNHDPNQLLARTEADTLSLLSDKKGLLYDIDVGKTTVANDVVEHIRRGDLTGSSFAFRVVDERWYKIDEEDDSAGEIREILKVDLYDVGPVTYPAYEATTAGMRTQGVLHALDEARASYAAWKAAESSTSEARKKKLRGQMDGVKRMIELDI